MFFKKEKIDQLSDLELLEKYKKAQNPKYAGEIFTRYSELIFGVCLKYLKDSHTAEDESMHIFEKLLKVLHKYEIDNLKSWLGTLARNHCLTLLSKTKVENVAIENISSNIFVENMEDESPIEKEQLIEQLESKLALLSSDQKTCIELFYLQQKSYQEVSEITGLDLKKVKSHIQNGKRKLGLYLKTA